MVNGEAAKDALGERAHQPKISHFYYPSTLVLKNKYDIQDDALLKERMARSAEEALTHLRREPLPRDISSDYLKYIHYSLFTDVFEWAGQTRDLPFTFLDGSTAALPIAFTKRSPVQSGLEKLDQMLVDKNYLQNTSHQEFIDTSTQIFDLLRTTVAFMDGNQYAQKVFLERLAETAGHKLDFSVVTEERLREIHFAARRHGNLEPVRQMLNDISDPERVDLLKGAFDHVKNNLEITNIDDVVIRIATEGETYKGIYYRHRKDHFMIKRKNEFVICDRDHLTPREFKKLQSGDHLTFSVPRAEDLAKILIPEEKLHPLTKQEIDDAISSEAFVRANKREIQRLSQIVYGKSHVLDEKMEQIIVDSSLGEQLIAQIDNSPQSISKLNGRKILGKKNYEREYAEEHLPKFRRVVENYVYSVKSLEKTLVEEHECERVRLSQEVKMPSQNLQDVLSMPKEQQRDILSNSPLLWRELNDFSHAIRSRLSPSERKAIDTNDTEKLSKSLGMSEGRAKKIVDTVTKIKEAFQHVRELRTQRPRMLDMAS